LIGEALARLPAVLSSVRQVMHVDPVVRQGKFSAILRSARATPPATLDDRTFDGQRKRSTSCLFCASASATLPRGCCRSTGSSRARPENCARFARFGALAPAPVALAAGFVAGFLLFEHYQDAHFRTDACETLHVYHCAIARVQGSEPGRAGK
jgi:hypothetical protein